MKFLRFKTSQGHIGAALVEDGYVNEIDGDMFGEYTITQNRYPLHELKILPPCYPSKIIAVGLNYESHAAEMKKSPPAEPMIFLKPGTAVVGHDDDIVYPDYMSSRVDFEGELAVVIGRKAKNVTESSWREYVFGFTCVNDVTARDLSAKDVQFGRAKGFDTFAPIGPFIETELDPLNLDIKTTLNGAVKQHSNTSEMIFPVPTLVSFISRVMTLLPGDIICTGTPAGVSSMKRGDTVEVEIEGIGLLRNFVT